MGKPSLLILGGGFAGTILATKLSDTYDVTLVDRKAYAEVTFAMVRAPLDAKTAQSAIVNYVDIPKIGRFVQGSVVKLSSSAALLDSGETLTFQYCIISTGSDYSDTFAKSKTAFTREARIRELAAINDKVKAARSILVVGGGPTGVELAAEIVEAYAGKSVTLVTSAQRLLPLMPLRPSKWAQTWLEKHGVKVILAQKASLGATANSLVLSSGQELQGDLLFMTTGQTVHTEYLSETDLAKARDQYGAVKVDEYLRVQGFPNIFAVGDCNDVPEVKKGYLAGQQAAVTIANLLALAKSPSSKLKAYAPNGGQPSINFITLGRNAGVGNLGTSCTCVGGFPVATLKSKDLFVGKWRGDLKLKA